MTDRRAAGLIVATCDSAAARHAVTRWHYSGTMPLGRTVRYGVWWDGQFRGAIVYARGSNRYLGAQFGLGDDQRLVTELCRVAMADHPEFTVSAAVSASLRLLRGSNPGLRLVVSFADPLHGHHGGIYQASNWVYTGTTTTSTQYFYRGRWVHQRDFTAPPGFLGSTGGRGTVVDKATLRTRTVPPKHRYVYPMDRAMRRRLATFAQPYPEAS